MENQSDSPSFAKRSRRDAKQPLDALQIPDAQLQLRTVVAATGRSSSSIRRLVARKEFPEPLKFGKRCTRWRAGDVAEWLRKQGGAA